MRQLQLQGICFALWKNQPYYVTLSWDFYKSFVDSYKFIASCQDSLTFSGFFGFSKNIVLIYIYGLKYLWVLLSWRKSCMLMLSGGSYVPFIVAAVFISLRYWLDWPNMEYERKHVIWVMHLWTVIFLLKFL